MTESCKFTLSIDKYTQVAHPASCLNLNMESERQNEGQEVDVGLI